MPYFKLKIILFLFFSLSLSLNSFSQDSIKKRNIKQIFKTNLVGFVTGQYELAIEIPSGQDGSLQLTGGLIKNNETGNSNNRPFSINKAGYMGTIQYKIYTNGSTPIGTYFSPFIRLEKSTIDFNDNSLIVLPSTDFNLSYTSKQTIYSGGILLGHQIISKSGIAIDFYVGPQYIKKLSTLEYNIEELNEATSADKTAILGDSLFKDNFPKLDLEKDLAKLGITFGVRFGYTF